MNPSLSILYGIEDRHRKVEDLIHRKASGHRVVDGVIGFASGLIPGGIVSTATTTGLILAQTRLVYRPLSNQIALIYSASASPGKNDHNEVNEFEKEERVRAQGKAFETLYDLSFLLEILNDMTHDVLVGNALAAIPVFGAVAAAAVDVMIAATMTWRVGLMTALFYSNLGEWIGSRKETFELTKRLLPLSPKSHARANVSETIARETSILEKHFRLVEEDFIRPLSQEGRSKEEIIEVALGMNFPSYIQKQLPHLCYTSQTVTAGPLLIPFVRNPLS
jgi:hypothetical protein